MGRSRRGLLAIAGVMALCGSAGAIGAEPIGSVTPTKRPEPTPYESESLAVAREANRIAAAAAAQQATASDWQQSVTLGQVLLGLGTLGITGIATWAAASAARHARRAADESKRSADVAVNTLVSYERPFLLLEVVESGVTIDKKAKSTTFGETKYRFRNLGRVPAILTRRFFHLTHARDMPEAIDPEQHGQTVVHGIAIAANDGASEILKTSPALPITSIFHDMHRGGRDRDGAVFFLGYVEYRDLAGRHYVSGFCFKHIDNELGFQPLGMTVNGGPDLYNYDRALG